MDFFKCVELGNFVLGGGILAVCLKLNNTWNTMQDRVDLLYKDYCDVHNIPFKGLKNDF